MVPEADRQKIRWKPGAQGGPPQDGSRDPLLTDAFRGLLTLFGVKTVKLPTRSPDLNAYAERFVLSIRSERLDQIIPLGERHLRKAVREYTEHYHVERNHQGPGNELLKTPREEPNMDGTVECQERLGGVLEYDRRAACPWANSWHRTGTPQTILSSYCFRNRTPGACVVQYRCLQAPEAVGSQ